MKFDVSSIKVLDDAIALVRQRPEMFVGVGEVQPEFLATSLAHDALALGVRQVEIHHINEWWAVVSEEDWLTYHNDVGVRETFNRILPIPGSVNGCRSEVVVHALAAAVFTSKAGELVVLSGDEAAARSAQARDPLCNISNKRIVAFAMPEGCATEGRKAGEGDFGIRPGTSTGFSGALYPRETVGIAAPRKSSASHEQAHAPQKAEDLLEARLDLQANRQQELCPNAMHEDVSWNQNGFSGPANFKLWHRRV